MLVCAHPAIEPTAHTPLMLNTVLGFTAEQIGRVFSVPASTMATRLVRAKKRIKAARIPFRIPDADDLPARMASVLEAVYGAYVIDWATTGPQDRHLPSEALHLAEVLTRCAPGDAEAHGLAALVQLSASRAPARQDTGGRFVPLPDQDPSRWNSQLIDRAHEHLRAAHAQGQLGRFQLEAAIQAVHCAGDRPARRTGRRCLTCTACCTRSRRRWAAASPSPRLPPRSRVPPPVSPRSMLYLKTPASPSAASSPPAPPARTCSTGSGGAKRPRPPTTARSI